MEFQAVIEALGDVQSVPDLSEATGIDESSPTLVRAWLEACNQRLQVGHTARERTLRSIRTDLGFRTRLQALVRSYQAQFVAH